MCRMAVEIERINITCEYPLPSLLLYNLNYWDLLIWIYILIICTVILQRLHTSCIRYRPVVAIIQRNVANQLKIFTPLTTVIGISFNIGLWVLQGMVAHKNNIKYWFHKVWPHTHKVILRHQYIEVRIRNWSAIHQK